MKKSFQFTNSKVDYYFSSGLPQLKQIADKKNTILLTDANVFAAHENRFKGWKTMVIKAGEKHKIQKTVDDVIQQLITHQADRQTTLVGIGGGVITDLAGYIASVYMRGIKFGFIPTSLLGLVDASIGGKNGIDAGLYKNIVGTIRQPSFILHDAAFLTSLPDREWKNGFAEIIKHACIKDLAMFKELEENDLSFYQSKKKVVDLLIQRNALLKTKVVQADEFEKGDRKLLNFGHTLGHAVETQYNLSHGQAISIGMTYAAHLSKEITGFKQADRVVALLKQYGLPVKLSFDKQTVMNVLKMDKKKEANSIHFILLEKIGKAIIHPITIKQISQTI